MRYFKIYTFIFLYAIAFAAKGQGQGMRLQVGLEMGKYIRNWNYVKQVPVEVVFMGVHKINPRMYPRLSFGMGNYLKQNQNYEAEIAGYYVKPGFEFYFLPKDKPVSGVVGLNVIFGRYNYNNIIHIYNPVWGDIVERESMRNQTMNGFEFSYGMAFKIKDNFELKFLSGIRGLVGPNSFSTNAKGIIPGFGNTNGNYNASAFGSIILSYILN